MSLGRPTEASARDPRQLFQTLEGLYEAVNSQRTDITQLQSIVVTVSGSAAAAPSPGPRGQAGSDGDPGDDTASWGAVTSPSMNAPVWVSTPSPAAPYGVNMGALGAGTLQQTVAGGVATPSAFAGATGSIPFYVAGSQLAQDNANFFWDAINHRLGIGTNAPGFEIDVLFNVNAARGFRVTNTNAGPGAQVQNQLVNNVGSLAYYGIASSAFAGFGPLDAGKAFFGSNATILSIFTQSAHDMIFYTSATERARIAAGGNVSIANLTAGGVTYATAGTGVLAIGTAAQVAAAITWPATNRVLVSDTTSTAPIGTSSFQFDLSGGTRVLFMGSGTSQKWANVGVFGDANTEYIESAWAANLWTLASKKTGGGTTVRSMKIDADTASLTLRGLAGWSLTSTSVAVVAETGGTGHNMTVTGNAGDGQFFLTAFTDVILLNNTNSSLNMGTLRAVLTGTSSQASSAGLILDAIKLSAGGVVTGSTNITTATGFNHVVVPRPSVTKGDAGAVTVTNSASFYVENAPLAGSSITITNAYAVWVDAGLSRFDGNGTHVFELPADATGNVTAATGRVPINIGGATKYFRYFDS